MEYQEERYVGLRTRYPFEDCPTCSTPGVGMILDLDKKQWICSLCYCERLEAGNTKKE